VKEHHVVAETLEQYVRVGFHKARCP